MDYKPTTIEPPENHITQKTKKYSVDQQVRAEVLVTVNIKIPVIWDVSQYSLVNWQIMTIKATGSSSTFIPSYRTARAQIPEGSTHDLNRYF
jgi:hypothetical protein